MRLFPVTALPFIAALAACAPDSAAPSDAPPAAGAPTAPAAETPANPEATPVGEGAEGGLPELPLVEASATQCVERETHLYSCPMADGDIVSVCVGNREVSYRYGPPGAPEIDITVRAGDTGVWQGGVSGQGGGQQTHIRFERGGYDYVVHSGYTGSLADQPGREWSGVAVQRDGAIVGSLACPVRSSQTEIPASMIPAYIPVETDERYDAWF